MSAVALNHAVVRTNLAHRLSESGAIDQIAFGREACAIAELTSRPWQHRCHAMTAARASRSRRLDESDSAHLIDDVIDVTALHVGHTRHRMSISGDQARSARPVETVVVRAFATQLDRRSSGATSQCSGTSPSHSTPLSLYLGYRGKLTSTAPRSSSGCGR